MQEIKLTVKPEWRRSPAQGYYMFLLYLGTVCVAKYRKFFKSGGKVSYIATCPMPTIETDLGVFENEDEAKLACLKAAKLFVEQLQRVTP